MAAVLPSQAVLTRFTALHPRHLLFIITVRNRRGLSKTQTALLAGYLFAATVSEKIGTSIRSSLMVS
jgi:hypothetical protein